MKTPVVVFLFVHHQYDVLRDILPFVQFKKRIIHLWRSVILVMHHYYSNSITSPWVFFTSINCANRTKPRKASHDLQPALT